jgi:glycosyltransferase involved in cell wall biosynthesis
MGAPGGIGRYERLISEALRELAGTSGLRIDVLQLAAAATSEVHRSTPGGVRSFVANGSKPRLVAAFVAALLRHRNAVVLFGHVNLTPLSLLVRPFLVPHGFAVLAYGIDVWTPVNHVRHWALRQASLVLAISADTSSKLVDVQGVSPERIRLLPFGYRARQSIAVPASHSALRFPRLLSVTRLAATERYKGVDTVIRSLPEVIARYPALRYTVIGSGADQHRLQALAHELGVSDHVCFAGFLPDDELERAYAECDIFVLPSKKEGLGIVYLEAMAHAKAVVAAGVGGVPDVVVDGETGLLIDYDDTAALAQALLTLLADSDLRRRLGDAGLERLRTHFSYEQFTRRLRHTLQELASDGRGPVSPGGRVS